MWLVLKDSGMWKEQQALENAEKGDEPGNQREIDCRSDHQQQDLAEEEFDKGFWIKVIKLEC